jgi:hypothetical protein
MTGEDVVLVRRVCGWLAGAEREEAVTGPLPPRRPRCVWAGLTGRDDLLEDPVPVRFIADACAL